MLAGDGAVASTGDFKITSISSAGSPVAGTGAGAVARQTAAIAAALCFLVLPALWNKYPLLEYDTGGYLARWYEGYLVPSRSTVYGLFLHVGERAGFWPELLAQSAATVWIIDLTLRMLGLGRSPWRMAGVIAALSVLTSLPWLTSVLLTDIFAGLAVLALHLMLFHGGQLSRWEKRGLFLLVAFAAATHQATLAVLMAQLVATSTLTLVRHIPTARLLGGAVAIVAGAMMLVAANFAVARMVAWTPGGYGIAFGRMLQDGIVARYLADHCPDPRLKLCPYRDALPATADEFLWGNSAFNRLGRFTGLEDEMHIIVVESLREYPLQQLLAAARSTALQLVMVGSGYGINDRLPHTYGIIERYIPSQAPAMHAARQQHGELGFDAINRLHVPVALASMLLAAGIIAWALALGTLDDIALLAGSAMFAILVNAFVCGVLSGPHDRYGARLAWLATFAVVLALMRKVRQRTEPG